MIAMATPYPYPGPGSEVDLLALAELVFSGLLVRGVKVDWQMYGAVTLRQARILAARNPGWRCNWWTVKTGPGTAVPAWRLTLESTDE